MKIFGAHAQSYLIFFVQVDRFIQRLAIERLVLDLLLLMVYEIYFFVELAYLYFAINYCLLENTFYYMLRFLNFAEY